MATFQERIANGKIVLPYLVQTCCGGSQGLEGDELTSEGGQWTIPWIAMPTTHGIVLKSLWPLCRNRFLISASLALLQNLWFGFA